MIFRRMLGTTLKTGTNGNMKGAAQKSLSSWTSSSEQGLRMFDNATILEHIKPSKEINDVVERALDKLSKEEVDIPRLKNLNILDKEDVGPGESLITPGYIEGEQTFCVKIDNIFYDRTDQKPHKYGLNIVCSAKDGMPLAVLQDNRYLRHVHMGAAGAVAVKHLTGQQGYYHVGFLGTGTLASTMALSSHHVHAFEQAYAYDVNKERAQSFANTIHSELGYRVKIAESAEEVVRNSDVLFCQTPAASPVFEASWLKPNATVIASSSDRHEKNQVPLGVMKHCKLITDSTALCAQRGELHIALRSGVLVTRDVYAELGEVAAGVKTGRDQEDRVIVVDLTGTAAQDAAIAQYTWSVLSQQEAKK